MFSSAARRLAPVAAFVLVWMMLAGPALAAVNAVDDAAVGAEDTILDIAVLENDSSDGSPPTISAVSAATNGTTSIIGNLVRYSPNPDFFGSDSFTYEMTADGFTDTATVFVTINGTNDPPNAAADFASVAEDGAVTVPVLANDSDPDGDPLTLSSVGPAASGSTTLSGSSVSYVPDPDFNGSDSFTYTVSDGAGGLATGSVSITVTAVNDPPVAADDGAGTFRETPVSIDVVGNDTDIDGDALAVAAVGAATNGTTSIDGSGSVRYTPAVGFVGFDSFTYTVGDPSGSTDTAVVSVSVSATNHPPVAIDDFAVTGPDTPVTIDPVANDSDMDGDTLSVAALGSPARGTVTLNGDGTVTYTPETGFAGLDAFAYTASDGVGGTDSGTVTVSVAPASGAPTANPDLATIAEDTAGVIDVLANDTSDLALAVQSVSNASHGSVALQLDGTIVYTPVADFNGADSFTYVVTDLEGAGSSALVSVLVTPVNDPVVAIDDTVRAEGGVPVEFNVLLNDEDIDGDILRASRLSSPQGGELNLSAEGAGRFVPDDGFVGMATFRYEACDPEVCDAAVVTIEVTAPAPLPPIGDPAAPDLPQLATRDVSPPLTSRPVITPSIGLSLAGNASWESLGVLLLPLAMLGVVMVWVLSANQFPFLFFWRRGKKKEEAYPPIG